MKETKGNELWILAMVSVVAVVGIVAIFLANGGEGTTINEPLILLDEEGNMIGQATAVEYSIANAMIAAGQIGANTQIAQAVAHDNSALLDEENMAGQATAVEYSIANAMIAAGQIGANTQIAQAVAHDNSALLDEENMAGQASRSLFLKTTSSTTNSCFDKDGKNLLVRSSATGYKDGIKKGYVDTCHDGDTVKEAICVKSYDKLKSTSITYPGTALMNCAAGYVCETGKCVEVVVEEPLPELPEDDGIVIELPPFKDLIVESAVRGTVSIEDLGNGLTNHTATSTIVVKNIGTEDVINDFLVFAGAHFGLVDSLVAGGTATVSIMSSYLCLDGALLVNPPATVDFFQDISEANENNNELSMSAVC